MSDILIAFVFLFIHVYFSNIYPKILGIKNKEINYIQQRLDELKNKPNKSVEEQLEYIELKKSGMNKFNFSFTSLIKLFIFILFYQIFKNKLILIGLGIGYIIFKNLVNKNKFILGKMLFEIENYLFIFIFIRFIQLFGFLQVLGLFFISSFIFNILNRKNRW